MQQNLPGSRRKEEMGISFQRKLHLQVRTDGLSMTEGPLFPARYHGFPALCFQGFHHSLLQFPVSALLQPLCTKALLQMHTLLFLKRMYSANGDRDEGKSPWRFSSLIQAGSGFCFPAHRKPPCLFPHKPGINPLNNFSLFVPILKRKLTATTMPCRILDPASHALLSPLQPFTVIPSSHHLQGLCLPPSQVTPLVLNHM